MPDTREKPGRYILKSADYRGVGWRQGERLEQLFEERCDALRRARQDGGGLAVDGPAERLSYIISDASVRMMLTSSGRLMYLACRLSHCGYPNSAARGLPHTRAADPGYRGDRLFGLSVSPLFRLVS